MDDSTRLKKTLDKIKSEIHTREGEMNALATRLKDDFNGASVEEAYKQFDTISSDIEELENRKSQLLRQAKTRLEKYGYFDDE